MYYNTAGGNDIKKFENHWSKGMGLSSMLVIDSSLS